MKAQDYYKLYTPRQVDLSDIPKSRVFKTVELVTKDDPNKILDVGCGSGVIPQLFKRGDNEVLGIKMNKEQGDIANKRLDNVIIRDVRFWTEKWLKEHLEKHGFSDIRIISDGFLIGGVIRYNFNIVEKMLNFIEYYIPGICNVLMVQAIKTQEIKVEHELIKSGAV
jgi:SAM-dependent methyltransferase